MTLKLDVRVRHGVKLSNDFDLFTKSGDSDVVPMEKNATTIAFVTFIKG